MASDRSLVLGFLALPKQWNEMSEALSPHFLLLYNHSFAKVC